MDQKQCPICLKFKRVHVFYLCHRCKELVCVSCLDTLHTSYCYPCSIKKRKEIRAAYQKDSCAPQMGFVHAKKEDKPKAEPVKAVTPELPAEGYISPRIMTVEEFKRKEKRRAKAKAKNNTSQSDQTPGVPDVP